MMKCAEKNHIIYAVKLENFADIFSFIEKTEVEISRFDIKDKNTVYLTYKERGKQVETGGGFIHLGDYIVWNSRWAAHLKYFKEEEFLEKYVILAE